VSVETIGPAPRTLAAATLVATLAASIAVRIRLDRETETRKALSPVAYVTSGATLRRLSLGYQGLLADFYWTRAVQYFGGQKLSHAGDFRDLGQILRVTTELDPHLLIAYRFGAIFLAEKPPAGAGEPEEAIALIRRGIAANPSYWRLWEDLGFIYYWDLKDYARAAAAFQEGSRQPGADLWMKALAASVAAQGGELSTSRLLWSEVHSHAANESVRRSAAEHLAAIKAAEDMAQLDLLLEEFRRREGRPATSISDVVRAGMLPGQPTDPSGVRYGVGQDGKAVLGPRSGVDLRLVH
jgi:tetratricopeptide (TPR) repeat protein